MKAGIVPSKLVFFIDSCTLPSLSYMRAVKNAVSAFHCCINFYLIWYIGLLSLCSKENGMLKVKDIMTTEVFVLHATQTLELVRSLMRIKHVRHVPIVDGDNAFVGLMTHRDLLAQTISHLAEVDEDEQEYLDRHIHIVNTMKTDVLTADPEMDVCSAIAKLLDHKYGCLPVVSDGKLVGIVTEADFLNLTLGLLRDSDSTCV